MYYSIIDIKKHQDERGNLYVVENGESLPFEIARCFWIKNVPANETRGAHAHRTCTELIIAACGNFLVMVSDGKHSEVISLDSPNKALLVPPYTWCELSGFSKDALCLCMASQPYMKEGYINNYEEYKEIIRDGQYI